MRPQAPLPSPCWAFQWPAPPATDSALQHWLDGPSAAIANRAGTPPANPPRPGLLRPPPELTVIEIWPASAPGGSVLAPYLRDKGRTSPPSTPAPTTRPPPGRTRKPSGRIARQPALYDKVRIAHSPGLPDGVGTASADLLLTFMNLHNWITDGNADRVIRSSPGPQARWRARRG